MRDYIKKALRTESQMVPIFDSNQSRILHAGLGMATEAAEFLDALKKHFFYGAPTDRTNLVEEMGDLFWYMAIASDALGVDFDEIQRRNVNKLKTRYPDKYTDEKALNRDLAAEAEALKGAPTCADESDGDGVTSRPVVKFFVSLVDAKDTLAAIEMRARQNNWRGAMRSCHTMLNHLHDMHARAICAFVRAERDENELA